MRSYGEAIDVRTDPLGTAGEPAAPAQFLWRGRLYLVRDVLAHWVELGTWWSTPRRAAAPPVAAPRPGAVPHDMPHDVPAYADRPVPRSVAVDVGAVEREVWRVEAAPGRSGAVGVYDLVRDVPAPGPAPDPGTARELPAPVPSGGSAQGGRWRLARALD